MKKVTFEVKGDPVPKARPRVVRKGGKTWSYTPKRVKRWEKAINIEAKNHFETAIEDPVALDLVFYLDRPKSRKNDVWVPTTPDLDNLEKAFLDGLNGIAYKDDKLVVAKSSSKRYITQGEPRVIVKVTDLSKQMKLEGYIK